MDSKHVVSDTQRAVKCLQVIISILIALIFSNMPDVFKNMNQIT